MKVLHVISEHKKTKRLIDHATGSWIKPEYKCKEGLVECVIEVNGYVTTRHVPKERVKELTG